MLIAFWIVMPILVYLFVAGVGAKKIQKAVIKNCDRCSLSKDGEKWLHQDGYGDKRYSTIVHDASPFLSIFWPLVLPFMIGQFVADKEINRRNKEQRKLDAAEVRRNDEMAEQKHQLELAKLRARENQLLDQHLKLAEISERIQDK